MSRPLCCRSLLGKLLATVAVALALASPAARAAPSPGSPVALGAFISDSYKQPGLYDEYSRQIGRNPAFLVSYKNWSIRLIDIPQLDAVWDRGAVPLVTWEPLDFRGRGVPLRAIASGRYDPYVRRSAHAAAAWAHPILLRFAHEMNGNWFPWSRGKNGNTPQAYIAAWRRLVMIFRAEGARNVEWVWGPNANTSGYFPFAQFFPGDRWVDWLGLDGFNWSLSPQRLSFTEIFASSYNRLVRLSARPIIIAETGSWEEGGAKADWISSALTVELPRFTHVRGLAWWNVDDPRGDFRVDSSPAALAAFRAGISAPEYAVSRSGLLSTPRRLKGVTVVPVPSSDGPRRSLFERIEEDLDRRYLWFFVTFALLLVLGLAVMRVQRSSRTREVP